MQQISGHLDLSRLGSLPLRAGIVYLKSWPVFYSAQAAVDAAIQLREKVEPAEIKSVVVECYKRLLGRGATDAEKWAPKSRETADHSVPFCVAAALLDGAITSHTFESERFLDADTIELMAKVSLREDPAFTSQYPEKWNCRIIAETLAGVRHEVHVAYPKGLRKTRFRIARSRKSSSDWRSHCSERAAAGHFSVGLGGWNKPTISAKFFRFWHFHD
jgi:2-methylcitrate dehydratase